MLVNKSDILLPSDNLDMKKWSVIACDQFTSDLSYWQNLNDYIKNEYSTLNFIIPEVFLSQNAIFNCADNVKEWLKSGNYKVIKDSYILVNRKTPYTQNGRLGLVCSIDLENYKFNSKKCSSLIMPSEDTLKERVLPRVNQREKIDVEFPHIMLLFDDRKENILENLYKDKNNFEKLYDFDLNGNGGHIEGYRIKNNDKDLNLEFSKLLDDEYLKTILDGENKKVLFLVGDGNHSLATAKVCWDKIKTNLSQDERQNHLARYCLVEICNINDPDLKFYPIHRVVFDYTDNIIDELKALYKGNSYKEYDIYYDRKYEKIRLPQNNIEAIKLVQNYLEIKKIKVDYIHDTNNLIKVCDENKGLGIFLPTIQKKEIFGYVVKNGTMPKKSFSIGKSVEKRYYLEGKFIK